MAKRPGLHVNWRQRKFLSSFLEDFNPEPIVSRTGGEALLIAQPQDRFATLALTLGKETGTNYGIQIEIHVLRVPHELWS